MFSPSAGRNKAPILEVLKNHVPRKLRIGLRHLYFLEVASGFGEHVGYFARHLQGVSAVWQPSDVSNEHFESIQSHCRATVEDTGVLMSPPVVLDVRDEIWSVDASNDQYWTEPVSVSQDPVLKEALNEAFAANQERKFDLVLNINMIHICHPSCTVGLFSGASSVLCSKGILIMYGPFKIEGCHTAPSNEAFDEMLKRTNPEYGVRKLDEVIDIAKSNGMEFVTKVPMPADNFVIIFEKT